ncbi:MAG: hypothetical protein U0R50_15315 [Gaiellales bacterium]
MRLLLILIAAALLAIPATALAGATSHASGSSAIVSKTKPKQKKSKKKAKKAKKAKRQAARSGVASIDEREAKGPLTSLSPVTVGTLSCAVPATVSTSGFVVGDVVEITCDLVGGSWTLRKIKHEDDVAVPGAPGADDEVEVKGTISSLNPLTVGSTSCAVPAGVSLGSFAVGQFVEMKCELVGGVLTVTRLKLEDHADDNDDDHDHSGPGRGDDDDDDDHGDHSGHGGGGGDDD